MKIRQFLSMAVVALAFTACSDDYDDTALWNQVNDNTNRIEALETWQEQMNKNIAALQELINTTDYITSVTPVLENGEEVGYTLAFLHSDPITIYHGEKGDKGDQGEQGEQGPQGPQGEPGVDGSDGNDGSDGDTPIIGVKSDGGVYYWTVNGEWLLDEGGKKMPVTGEKGDDGDDAIAPQVRINSTTNEWEISIDGGMTWKPTGVTATGDSFFEDVDTSNPDYVIFTLANGNVFNVPKYQSLKIGEGTGTFTLTSTSTEIKLTYPDGTKASDYSALVAQITPEGANGTYTDIDSRSTDANGWSVTSNLEEAKVIVTAGSGKALLRVTLIQANGNEVTASRIVEKPNYTVSEDGKTYTVYNADGLIEWANAVNALVDQYLDLNCILADDIDMQGKEFPAICKGNGGYDWYTGTFNGNGHTISNLTITISDDASVKDYIGFIRRGDGCTVQDVTFKNLNATTSGSTIGGVMGQANGSTVVKNCHVIGGTVKGNGAIGGIIGFITSGDVEVYACSSSAAIQEESISYQGLGGIVGDNGGSYKYEGGKITACYATGSISNDKVGAAIAGAINYGEITACYWDMDDVTYGYYKKTDSGKEGVSEGKISGGNWDAAITAMNQALATAGIKDYTWIKNIGDDAENHPLIIQVAD